MITLDNIDALIVEAKKRAEKASKGASDYAGDSEYKRYHRLLLHKELLECGYKVEDHIHGFLVNDKFIVASQKWCVVGKYKWYWYSNVSGLKKYFTKG